VKVFANEEFGYQRITVDRPLRQRFEVTEETLAVLADAKPLVKHPDRDALIDAFKPLLDTVWWTKKEARNALLSATAEAGLPWPAPTTEKAIWSAIAVSDPEGELQTKNGKPLPDPDRRDYENVRLTEDIDEYFAREVLPHIPDAWIAEIKDPKTGATARAKIGYEIPFTRHFYVYKPPRPLAEIDAELEQLEARIQALLGEVTR